MKKIKKLFFVLLTIMMLLGSACFAFAGTIPKVYINGNKVMMQSSPFNEGGTIYIPLKALCDTMGISLVWDNGTITLKQSGVTAVTSIDSSSVDVNGETIQLEQLVKLVDGKTYVPAMFVEVALNAEIEIDKAANVLNIAYEFPTDGGQQFDIFGRLIRTTDLPGGAWNYPYIAAGVPNEMYEKDFAFDIGTWFIMPVENKDYIRPVNMSSVASWYNDANVKRWLELVNTNLDLRLNVNYKEVGGSWIEALVPTYRSEFNPQIYVDDMQEYINEIKRQELIVEGDYYIEPSIIYTTNGTRMRAWIKFILRSDNVNEARTYSSRTEPYVKTNIWYEGYVDFILGTSIVLRDDPGSNYKMVDEMFGYEISYMQENMLK